MAGKKTVKRNVKKGGAKRRACPAGSHYALTNKKGKIQKCFKKKASAKNARKKGQRVKRLCYGSR